MPNGTPGIALAALALRRGLVRAEDVRDALADQARDARDLGRILVSRGCLDEATLRRLLHDPELGVLPPLSGRKIGKYVIAGELGRGSMAVTYEARDLVLDRPVALKVFNRRLAERKPSEEERFIREARLAASLPPHPNLVSVFDSGLDDGERYLAMELIRGRTFSRGGPLGKSIELLRDVARALHHAHEHGIVHRDAKPANILVDAGGAPHVSDFGLAKNLEHPEASLTDPDCVVGTPIYMSPEQATGGRVDRRTDVYSLGVMLYEILTGEAPFRGKTPVETLLKTIKEPLRRPSAAAPSVDPQLGAGLPAGAAEEARVAARDGAGVRGGPGLPVYAPMNARAAGRA